MTTDTLSSLLAQFAPRTYVAGGLELGGEWAIRYDAHEGIKCFAVQSGGGWLAIDGKAPLPLEAGDCVLLPSGRRFVIARDPTFTAMHFGDIPESQWRGGIATVNGGGDTTLLGGHFAFAGDYLKLLLGVLPPIYRLRDADDSLGVPWALARLRDELAQRQPGSTLVVEHLAHLLLVHTLRLYIAEGVVRDAGWLFALGDRRMK